MVHRDRADGEPFVLIRSSFNTVGRTSVVADDPQHVLFVFGVTREGAEFPSHFGTGRVRASSEDGRDGGTDGPARFGVIWDAHLHEHRAEVGKAQTKGAVLPRSLRDGFAGERGHENADFENNGPQTGGVLETIDIKSPALTVVELHEVDGRKIACGVVKEHVLRTWVRSVDPSFSWTGVPFIDGAVVLQTRVCASPSGEADLIPEFLGRNGLGHRAIGSVGERPVAARFNCLEELVGEPNGVVGILAAYGVIRLTIEVVVEGESQLLGECFVLVAQAFQAFNQSRDLDFFANLPVHEGFDIRVVGVKTDHFCRATCGAAGLDGTSRTVADLEEAHEARTATTTGQRFISTTDVGEVCPRTGAILEESSFTGPKIHDSALAHQVIVDGLDEAGVRLRV